MKRHDDAMSSGMPLERVVLERSSLHPCLQEPVLGSINFLNEVIDRYPGAISFAPGAPSPEFLEDLDVAAHLQTYVEHLCRAEGLSAPQVRRRLFQYGPTRGIINRLLSEALRNDEGIEVAPASIVVTVGFQEAMFLVLRALCAGPRDVLAVVQPCFVGAIGAARVLGIDTVAVNEVDGCVDLAQLRDTCMRLRREGRRIRALYVAPDFSNPSGSHFDLAHREDLLALAQAQDFLLLEDTAYGFTAPPGQALPSLKALDRSSRVVHFGTFAKTCLPGVRVGFVVADQPVGDTHGRVLADELAVIKSMTTVNTSPVCQAIVGAMLLDGGISLAALGREKGVFYRGKLETLLAALDRHMGSVRWPGGLPEWNRPKGGFFVRMKVRPVVDQALLEFSAREHGVLWTPMSSFHLDGGGRHEMRLSCSYLTDDHVDEGARRLSRFLQDPRIAA